MGLTPDKSFPAECDIRAPTDVGPMRQNVASAFAVGPDGRIATPEYDQAMRLPNFLAYQRYLDQTLKEQGIDITQQHLPEGDPATQVTCLTIHPNIADLQLSQSESAGILEQVRNDMVTYVEEWRTHIQAPADIQLFYTNQHGGEFTIATTHNMRDATEWMFLISEGLRTLSLRPDVTVLSNELSLVQGLNAEERFDLLDHYREHACSEVDKDIEKMFDLPRVYGTDLETMMWLVEMLPLAYIPDQALHADIMKFKDPLLRLLRAELEKSDNPSAHRIPVGFNDEALESTVTQPAGFEQWRLDIAEQTELRHLLVQLMNKAVNDNLGKMAQTG